MLKQPARVDLLIVDDDFARRHRRIADALASSPEAEGRVHVLHRASKEGLGRAYLAGFAWAMAADYEAVVEMDADLSHDPLYLQSMVDAGRTADVVIGSRYLNGISVINWPLRRILLSWGANWYVRTVTRLTVNDCTSGYRLYHRRVLEAIRLETVRSNGYSFPGGDDVPGADRGLPDNGSADHLHGAAGGPVEAVQRGRVGVAHHALAPAVAGAGAEAGDGEGPPRPQCWGSRRGHIRCIWFPRIGG